MIEAAGDPGFRHESGLRIPARVALELLHGEQSPEQAIPQRPNGRHATDSDLSAVLVTLRGQVVGPCARIAHALDVWQISPSTWHLACQGSSRCRTSLIMEPANRHIVVRVP